MSYGLNQNDVEEVFTYCGGVCKEINALESWNGLVVQIHIMRSVPCTEDFGLWIEAERDILQQMNS